MSFSRGSSFGSQGAPVSGWRLALALIAVSMDAVGCQKARSGLSPVATLVCTPCSYGSGMVTTLTVAPVARWKASITCLGTVLLFWAAQMVRPTPSSLAEGSAQVVRALPADAPVPGSLQPVTLRLRASAAAAPRRVLRFIGSSFSGGATRSGAAERPINGSAAVLADGADAEEAGADRLRGPARDGSPPGAGVEAVDEGREVARVERVDLHHGTGQVGQGQDGIAGGPAAVPDREVGRVTRAQGQAEPRVRPARQAQRPQRRGGDEVGPETAVDGDRVPYGSELVLRHLVDAAGQVEPSEEGGAQRERDLLLAHVRLRVGPDAGLLGQQRHRCRRGDGRVAPEVLLVAGRLQVHPRQQGVVHAHGPRRAVLQDESGVPVQHLVQPGQVSAVVGEQPGTGAVGVAVGADAGVDVVVELEVADAELVHQPVDRLVQVGDG